MEKLTTLRGNTYTCTNEMARSLPNIPHPLKHPRLRTHMHREALIGFLITNILYNKSLGDPHALILSQDGCTLEAGPSGHSAQLPPGFRGVL